VGHHGKAKPKGLPTPCGGDAYEVPPRLDDGPALGLDGGGCGKLTRGVQHVCRQSGVRKLWQGLEGAWVLGSHALDDSFTLLAQRDYLCALICMCGCGRMCVYECKCARV